ncbi:cytosolic carboxypeptidase 1-like [Clytia hemisphaerica]
MEHPPTTPVQSSTALAAHLTTATTFQEPSYNANTEHNSKNHYSNNSDDVTAIASHHSSSSTSTAGGSNESESSLHSLCDTERFREFLQELDLYEDDDVHQSIHIPTASLETSFQSVEKANSLNGNCDFDGKTTCSHQLITTSEKNNKSNASGGGSSPLLERLKKFHIGRNHGKSTEPEEISSFRDRPRTTVHSTARMWSVEQSRVCPTLHNDSTSSVLNQSGSTFNQLNCRIQHVSEFVKIPEPTTLGHYPPSTLEPLLPRKTNLQKQMLFTDLSRQIFPDRVIKRVVYDLDELTKNTPPVTPNVSATNLLSSPPTSTNRIVPVLRKSQSAPKLSIHHLNAATLQRISKEDVANSKPLSFESRFECGNLRKAIQIRQYEYDLILNSDTNTCGHHQWFYFQVQNMEVNVEYRFNIINCEKPNSQFNYGMTSLMYSVVNAKRGNPSWHRTGTNVCYYRNYFVRGVGSSKSYFTATFTISFPHKNDTCFLAYHYPYSLSMLKMDVLRMEASLCQHIIYSNQVLCQTLGGNDVNLLTITNPSISATRRDIIKRPYVVLTARVHPGESNSSWIMKGILDFLTSSDTLARQLRSIYIFKIVPMLNPDGVVNGCHRCSLTGQDLNRQWKHPDPILHPSIYHVKTLIQSMTAAGKKPMLFVDFHGHSRKKNVFMYGCQEKQPETTLSATDERGDSLQTSCNSSSKSKGSTSMSSTTFRDDRSSYCSNLDFYNEDSVIKLFPRILSSVSPYFSLQNCNYAMEKSKEATARIVGFRELGIDRSYTLESSYSGMDQGEYAGYHIGTTHLEDMGRTFCRALFKFAMCPNVDTNDFTN